MIKTAYKINITFEEDENKSLKDVFYENLEKSCKEIRTQYLSNDWQVIKDKDGVDMIYYKNTPVDEIIYTLGELVVSNGSSYIYDDEAHTIAINILEDREFSKEFYTAYMIVKEEYDLLFRHFYLSNLEDL